MRSGGRATQALSSRDMPRLSRTAKYIWRMAADPVQPVTRHHDGFVRERHVREILDADHPWVPLFVLQLLGAYTTGPVPAFLVEDVASARAELEAARAELIGTVQRGGANVWQHF